MSETRAGSGSWLYRDVDAHKCIKPAYDSSIVVGDRWKCDCGIVYRVASIEYGTQWDPYPQPSVSWARVEEHGIYAPGTK